MMSKNEFSKVLAEAVKAKLEQMGTHVEIESREVLKNNGNVQNGLGISDGSNIQSVFYIDAMYERFVAGEGVNYACHARSNVPDEQPSLPHIQHGVSRRFFRILRCVFGWE